MIEWIKNCWRYILDNSDAILTILTSTQFIALATAVCGLIKSNKSNKESKKTTEQNTEKLNTLNDALNKVTETNEKLMKTNNELIKTIDTQKDELKTLKEENNILTEKVDIMLEVQSVVYSTIKDDTIRTNVNNLLMTGKYIENSKFVKMNNKIQELEKTVSTKTEEFKQDVIDTINETKPSVDAAQTVKNNKIISRV